MTTKKQLDGMMKSILGLGNVPHKRPEKPTKRQLNERFKLSLDRKTGG